MRTVESLKICNLIGSFCPKHMKIKMKKYRRVSLMTLKSDAKKTDSRFHTWHEEFSDFNASSGKSENFHFDSLLL